MRRLGRVLLALALFLVAAEGMVRGVLRFDGSGKMHALGWRTQRAAVVMDAVASDAEGLTRFPVMQHDPDLGWVPRPGRHERDGVVVTIDGSHRRVTAPPHAAPTGPRVVLVGDSFTFGDEVSDDETWAWHLRAHTGAEVLNLGANGYGLDQAWLRWQRDGVPVAPDVLVIGHLEAMHERTAVPFFSWAKPWYGLDGGRLVLRGVPVPSPDELLPRDVRRPMLGGLLLDVRDRLMEPEGRRQDRFFPVSVRLLERIIEDARSRGARVVLARLVHEDEVRRTPEGGGDVDRMLDRACEHFDILCVDTRPVIREGILAGESLYRVAHWSPEGNRRVGAEIARAMTAGGLLDGPPVHPTHEAAPRSAR